MSPDTARLRSGRDGHFFRIAMLLVTLLSLPAIGQNSGSLIYLDDFRGNDSQSRFVMEAEIYSGRTLGTAGEGWWEINGMDYLVQEGPMAGETAPGAFVGARGNYMEVLGPTYLPIDPTGPSYTGPFLDYRVRVESSGTYELFIRWAGRTGDTDSIFAFILDPGGAPLTGSGPDYFTFHQYHGWEWENDGIADSTGVGFSDQAIWTLDQPGDYTIRFAQRETESALDALIFQSVNLTDPIGLGPSISVTVPEPSQIPILVAGLAGVWFLHKSRRKKQVAQVS